MTTLSPDERAYHATLVAQKKASDAAWASWAQHLAAKYRLGPDDGISETGDVLRAPAPDSD